MMNRNINALKIYIAGAYSAPTNEERKENVSRAVKVSIALYKKGHFPFVPHLTHFIDYYQTAKPFLRWDDYMRCDLAWLQEADAFFFIGHSKGADIELAEAKINCLEIFTSLDEVPDVTDNSSNLFG